MWWEAKEPLCWALIRHIYHSNQYRQTLYARSIGNKNPGILKKTSYKKNVIFNHNYYIQRLENCRDEWLLEKISHWVNYLTSHLQNNINLVDGLNHPYIFVYSLSWILLQKLALIGFGANKIKLEEILRI